jgi:hypothetical protein
MDSPCAAGLNQEKKLTGERFLPCPRFRSISEVELRKKFRDQSRNFYRCCRKNFVGRQFTRPSTRQLILVVGHDGACLSISYGVHSLAVF